MSTQVSKVQKSIDVDGKSISLDYIKHCLEVYEKNRLYRRLRNDKIKLAVYNARQRGEY